MQLQYSNSVYKTPLAHNAISKYSTLTKEREEEQLRSQALEYLSKNTQKMHNYPAPSITLLDQLDRGAEYTSFASQLKQKKEFEEINKKAKEFPSRLSNEVTKSEGNRVASNFMAIYKKETNLKSLQNRTTSLLPTENSLHNFNKNLTEVNRAKYINSYLENSPQLIHYQVS